MGHSFLPRFATCAITKNENFFECQNLASRRQPAKPRNARRFRNSLRRVTSPLRPHLPNDPAVKKRIAQPNGHSLQNETRPLQEGGFDLMVLRYLPLNLTSFSIDPTDVSSDCVSAGSETHAERSGFRLGK